MFAWAFWVAGMVHHVDHVNKHEKFDFLRSVFVFETDIFCFGYVVFTDVSCERFSTQPLYSCLEEINKVCFHDQHADSYMLNALAFLFTAQLCIFDALVFSTPLQQEQNHSIDYYFCVGQLCSGTWHVVHNSTSLYLDAL